MPERNERDKPDEKRANKKPEDEEKQSYYEDIFDEAERADFDLAAGVDGIDDEIALLRAEIKKAVAGEDISRLREIVMATNALERLIRTKYQISKDQKKSLKEQLSKALQESVLAVGVAAATEMVKRQIGG